MLFYMTYGISLIHKRKANKIAKERGTYYIEVKEGIILAGDPKKEINLSQCNVIWIHSDTMHVIQADRDVFFLPVRLMTEVELEQFEKIMKTYCTKHIFVTIDEAK